MHVRPVGFCSTVLDWKIYSHPQVCLTLIVDVLDRIEVMRMFSLRSLDVRDVSWKSLLGELEYKRLSLFFLIPQAKRH